ncbi:NAD-dependent malic enzyme [Candidatus Micrarchaeota archaeon CG10_big_fil_rev_8_21_14_0_10_59_7]|nr:MAG: NAD-dependent malic enzyme [Candidatus Micrarchaeota archaeon CG10_big_fil_rev_8_21_14_0_10_59_7]
MSGREAALRLHKGGKLAVASKVPLNTKRDLSLAYTPGVAEPCLEIAKNPKKAYDYTSKWNSVAIATDGTAVLGLGNIGPQAALPVMEGKALLFKKFGGIDAFPICVNAGDENAFVDAVASLEPTFGGINLEDLAAPHCFRVEEALKKRMGIPVFHDDQHGTAIVATAALTNALKVVGKKMPDARIAISGAGAAGTAVAKMLLRRKPRDIIISDSHGIIAGDRADLNEYKAELARTTNKRNVSGTLADAMAGADVFIGVSAPRVVTREMVAAMAPDAIVMAMANPAPEIMPQEAKRAGAAVVATGRSDFPNQVNNVLAFPGVFRGALDCRAPQITEKMKDAAADAIASMVKKPNAKRIVPSVFDDVASVVAKAVIKAR